jgi:hypothetical protein
MPDQLHTPRPGRTPRVAARGLCARCLLFAVAVSVLAMLAGVHAFAGDPPDPVKFEAAKNEPLNVAAQLQSDCIDQVAGTSSLAASAQGRDHWMADLGETVGQRPLRQIVIPGSHDAGTYDWFDMLQFIAEAQDVNITDQLNAGSRYLDVRAGFTDNQPSGGPDYWNRHGPLFNPQVRLSQMLDMLADWANQPAHQNEIVLLDVQVDPTGHEDRLNQICQEFMEQHHAPVLQPSMLRNGTSIYDMTMNDIWALPNHPRIITNWSYCTGQAWPAVAGAARLPVATRYADRCKNAQAIIDGLAPSLEARTDDQGALAIGFYVLFIQGTPEGECGFLGPAELVTLQGPVLETIQSWRQQDQNNSLANANLISIAANSPHLP